MKIKIWESDEGYMFNIWLDEDADEIAECDDGGLCTGNYEDAIEMATIQAKDLLRNKKNYFFKFI